MIFERFEHEGLAHYSYAIGCAARREVAIVDPARAVELYLAFAAERDLAITHVLETHIHADYASGASELAAKAGILPEVSGYDEGERYEVSFPHVDLREGQALELGAIRIEPLHTPGHTPEHLAFLVYDGHRTREVPFAMASGDFLFVGSLGRPDLLGQEATEELARQLYRSSRSKLAGLPDGLEIHPAHGAGSMCGASIGARAQSTLGYERVANPLLDPALHESAFVAKLLANLPPQPDYYARMKRLNAAGAQPLGGAPRPEALDVEEFAARIERGALVVDLREPAAFGAGHVPGSLSLGAGNQLASWAGWVLPADRALLFVGEDRGQVEGAARELIEVGLDRSEGWLRGGVEAWTASGRSLAENPQITPRRLFKMMEGGEPLALLDVRTANEWASGRVSGAVHVPAGELVRRLAEVPRVKPLAVMCGGGYRSSLALSLLERQGVPEAINVIGGMAAWREAQLPLAR